MMRIELYVDREDRLTLDIYSNMNSDNILKQLKGRMCYDLIKEICSHKIISITSKNEDLVIKTTDCIFTINEYKKTFDKNGTKVIQNTIADFLSKQKLKQVQPKKVTRKNKHTGKKIIATVLAALILATIAMTETEGKSYDDTNTIQTYSSQQNEMQNTEKVEIAIVEDTESETEVSLVEESEQETEFSPNTIFVSLDYEDRYDTDKAQITREYYIDAIKKYSEIYGVDYELMTAIATQERGVHSEIRDPGGAIGLFQIEGIWTGEELTAYNYETKEYETIIVDGSRLSDVFYNIKVGCMVFQTALNYMNYNIPAAIQCYNMGYGNMQKILTACSNATGKSVSEILSDPTNLDWLQYRNYAVGGDKQYLENVSSYMNQNTEINVFNGEEEINMNIKMKI